MSWLTQKAKGCASKASFCDARDISMPVPGRSVPEGRESAPQPWLCKPQGLTAAVSAHCCYLRPLPLHPAWGDRHSS